MDEAEAAPRLFLISEDRLKILASLARQVCQICEDLYDVEIKSSGTAAHVQWSCPSGHSNTFCTQKTTNKKHVGDLNATTAFIESGDSQEKIVWFPSSHLGDGNGGGTVLCAIEDECKAPDREESVNSTATTSEGPDNSDDKHGNTESDEKGEDLILEKQLQSQRENATKPLTYEVCMRILRVKTPLNQALKSGENSTNPGQRSSTEVTVENNGELQEYSPVQETCGVCTKTFTSDLSLQEREVLNFMPMCEECRTYYTSAEPGTYKPVGDINMTESTTSTSTGYEHIEVKQEYDEDDESILISDSEVKPSEVGNVPTQSSGIRTVYIKNGAVQGEAKEKSFECHECGQIFTQRYRLVQHMRSSSHKFLCHECGKVFLYPKGFEDHLRQHTGDKPFQCPHCDKSFNNKHNFIGHQRIHTGEKPYHCQECGRSFTLKSGLSKHMRTHTGEKPYKCELCDKAFARIHHLNKHMNTPHTGYERYVRDLREKGNVESNNILEQQSEKGNVDSNNLPKHVKTGPGERRYQCLQCGRTYTRKSNVILHMRTHTGEKPYICKECGKAFSRNDHLVVHMRTHTGEKPYKCKYCVKEFRHKYSLKPHIMKKHAGEM